jgi:hypothetical protein
MTRSPFLDSLRFADHDPPRILSFISHDNVLTHPGLKGLQIDLAHKFLRIRATIVARPDEPRDAAFAFGGRNRVPDKLPG